MEKDLNVTKLIKLFTTSFFISLFMIGSGHVTLPLYKKKMVTDYQWLTEQEMMDILVIAQCCPGAIAVNMAVAIGYKISGFLGSLVMVIGTILPPLVLMIIIQSYYQLVIKSPVVAALFRGMNAAVTALLIDIVISFVVDIKENKLLSYSLIAIVAGLIFFFKINVLWVMACSVILAIYYSWRTQR